MLALRTGVVTNNRDPLGLHRVQVRLTGFEGKLLTPWLRMILPSAGPPPATGAVDMLQPAVQALNAAGGMLNTTKKQVSELQEEVAQLPLLALSARETMGIEPGMGLTNAPPQPAAAAPAVAAPPIPDPMMAQTRVEAVPGASAASAGTTTTPDTGHGFVFLPEVGDEVVVIGDDQEPDGMFVLGCVYNGLNKPAYANGDGQNNTKLIRTKSGNQIAFYDTSGGSVIRISAQTVILDGAQIISTVPITGAVTMWPLIPIPAVPGLPAAIAAMAPILAMNAASQMLVQANVIAEQAYLAAIDAAAKAAAMAATATGAAGAAAGAASGAAGAASGAAGAASSAASAASPLTASAEAAVKAAQSSAAAQQAAAQAMAELFPPEVLVAAQEAASAYWNRLAAGIPTAAMASMTATQLETQRQIAEDWEAAQQAQAAPEGGGTPEE